MKPSTLRCGTLFQWSIHKKSILNQYQFYFFVGIILPTKEPTSKHVCIIFVFIEIGIIIESVINNRVTRACIDMPSAIVSNLA